MSIHPFAIIALLAMPMMNAGCVPLAVSAVSASGMDATDARADTAEHFGVSTSSVKITSFNNGGLDVIWQARVNGKTYNCTKFAVVICTVPGGA